MRNFCLNSQTVRGYAFCAPAKSGAGRGNPDIVRAHNRASGFFVCVARLHLSMVGRAGQLSGWPGSLATGISTPARLTTNYERGNSGGELTNLSQEDAANMATTPTQTHPQYIFYFLAVRRSDLHDRPHRETITAPDELTARRVLARDFVLAFAGRVPVQEVRHA